MSSSSNSFARVVEIMHRLRAPGGCPWDREQSFDSIRPHTLEEAYEVLEAIDDRNWAGLREELGDLLLQVVFYAEMAEEQHYFTIEDVLQDLAAKLVRRHPHVFGDADGAANPAISPEAALRRWDEVKAQERRLEIAADDETSGAAASLMDGVPKGLPALAEAVKLGHRAARVGFDWSRPEDVWNKVEEELAELRAEMAGSHPAIPGLEDELGDVLFSLTNLARRLGLEPESALKRSNRKFMRRFRAMEAAAGAAGRDLRRLSPEEWDALWVKAKQETGTCATPPRPE